MAPPGKSAASIMVIMAGSYIVGLPPGCLSGTVAGAVSLVMSLLSIVGVIVMGWVVGVKSFMVVGTLCV